MAESSAVLNQLFEGSRRMQSQIVQMRRDLHQIPELGCELPMTTSYIKSCLDKFHVEWRECGPDSGIIAEIRGEKPGGMIGLRADIDALPIEEALDVPYRSRFSGRMHACGHDAHAAMLLGAASLLSEQRSELCGTVRLLFQPGEETGDGALRMISAHAADGLDAVVGLHIGTLMGKEVPSGKIGVISGNVTCYKDKFMLKINGRGCHGAKPHEGIDPITIGSHLVVALEELFAREVPAGTPAVLTFGSFNSGSGENAIPSEAVLRGSMRTKDPLVRDLLKSRMLDIVNAVTHMYRGTCELAWLKSSIPVRNDEAVCQRLADLLAEGMPAGTVLRSVNDPLLGSDDFTHFAELKPSAYIFLSSSDPEKHTDIDHHSPYFNIDEDVLWKGCAVYCAAAMLSNGPDGSI